MLLLQNLKKKNRFRGGGGLKAFRFHLYTGKKNEKENKILSLIRILNIPGIRGAPMITLQAPDYHTQGS